MSKAWLCSLLIVLSLGCGGDDDGGPPAVVGGDGGPDDRNRCTDEDDDGFGTSCMFGPDCDDGDPAVTNECVRCADTRPTADWENCPCEEGTMPMYCKLDAAETRQVTRDGVMGSLVCVEGTRYCRDDLWTDCEALWSLAVFVPD